MMNAENSFEKNGDGFCFNGKGGYDAESLLSAISESDDYEMTAPLKAETAEFFKSAFSGCFNVPEFEKMLFPPLSSALLDHLAADPDETLISALKKSLGIRDKAENDLEAARRAQEEIDYKAFWRDFAKSLLERDEFLSFRFSPLKPFADGAFLYDDERVWAYVIISREGGKKRRATVALQLLADEDAVSGAEDALSLAWCRHFEEEGSVAFRFGTVKSSGVSDITLYKRFYLEFESPLTAIELSSAIAAYKAATEVFPLG
jgi:hypothetical protein